MTILITLLAVIAVILIAGQLGTLTVDAVARLLKKAV